MWFEISAFRLKGVTGQQPRSFDPGEIADAIARCSPLEFEGSAAAPTDEE